MELVKTKGKMSEKKHFKASVNKMIIVEKLKAASTDRASNPARNGNALCTWWWGLQWRGCMG